MTKEIKNDVKQVKDATDEYIKSVLERIYEEDKEWDKWRKFCNKTFGNNNYNLTIRRKKCGEK